MHLMIYFELNEPVIGKHYNRTQKRLKLGLVSSFDPHSMCEKVERIMEKNRMHFVYKLDNLFQSTRVSHENTCVSKAFHFSKLISTQDFFASNMQHSKPHTKISTLSEFICYFSCI